MSSLKWAFLDFKVSVFWLLCLIIFYGSISLTVWSLFLTLYAYIFVNFIFQHFLLELYNNCLHQKYYSISLPKTFLLGFSSTTTICHTYLWNKIILLPLLLLQKIILQLKCYLFFLHSHCMIVWDFWFLPKHLDRIYMYQHSSSIWI